MSMTIISIVCAVPKLTDEQFLELSTLLSEQHNVYTTSSLETYSDAIGGQEWHQLTLGIPIQNSLTAIARSAFDLATDIERWVVRNFPDRQL